LKSLPTQDKEADQKNKEANVEASYSVSVLIARIADSRHSAAELDTRQPHTATCNLARTVMFSF